MGASTDCLSVRVSDGGTGARLETEVVREDGSERVVVVDVDVREGEPGWGSRVDESGELDGGNMDVLEDADARSEVEDCKRVEALR